MRRSKKPGFTLKHHDRKNQVRHTGGTLTMKMSAEKTEAGYRPTLGKRLNVDPNPLQLCFFSELPQLIEIFHAQGVTAELQSLNNKLTP